MKIISYIFAGILILIASPLIILYALHFVGVRVAKTLVNDDQETTIPKG